MPTCVSSAATASALRFATPAIADCLAYPPPVCLCLYQCSLSAIAERVSSLPASTSDASVSVPECFLSLASQSVVPSTFSSPFPPPLACFLHSSCWYTTLFTCHGHIQEGEGGYTSGSVIGYLGTYINKTREMLNKCLSRLATVARK